MANYSVNGTGNQAVAGGSNCGILKLENWSSGPTSTAEIYEFSIGAFGAASDNNYSVLCKRTTTTGQWYSQPAQSLDAKSIIPIASGWRASSTTGTFGGTLASWSLNNRGSMRWVAVPGGELCLPGANSSGIVFEFGYAQSTDLFTACALFRE